MSTIERTEITEERDEPLKDDPRVGRRALMLGGAAGVAGVAIAAITNSSPAEAAAGDPLTLGNGGTPTANDAGPNQTSMTANPPSGSSLNVYNTTANLPALYGQAHGSSGISDIAAVIGDSDQVDGVLGLSSGGVGVHGVTTADAGTGADTVGVLGEDTSTVPGGTGVYGSSVHGHGVQGVTSGSDGFTGVHGKAIGPGAYGVFGEGLSTSGVGVRASSPGTALQVNGAAQFTRSGVATLSAAATSVVVTVLGGLKATSHVLATLQTDGAVGLAVRAAVPNTSTGKVTIYFTESAPAGTKVGWFVFG